VSAVTVVAVLLVMLMATPTTNNRFVPATAWLKLKEATPAAPVSCAVPIVEFDMLGALSAGTDVKIMSAEIAATIHTCRDQPSREDALVITNSPWEGFPPWYSAADFRLHAPKPCLVVERYCYFSRLRVSCLRY
jgi:hypothetical protein